MKTKKLMALLLAVAVLAGSMMSGCGSTPETASTEETQTAETETTETATEETKEETSSSEVKIDENASLVRAESADISAITPINQSSADAQEMMIPIFDMLYRVYGEGTKYYLAESYTVSDDNMTVTIKLKEGITYHDGTPLNADEIVWNFNTLKQSALNSWAYTVNGKEVEIEKIDDLTVQLNLPEPSASYAAMVGMMQPIPSHMYKDVPDILNCEANEIGIGTGPYKVKEWNKGESLVLERYDDYYGGKAPIKTLVFKIIPNTANQAISFESGELSALRLTNVSDLEKYENRDDIEIVSFPEGRNHYIAFNALSEKMQDPKVREAITLALNREELVLGAYGDNRIATPAQNVFTKANLYYPESVTAKDQDLEKAKQLIQETGLEGTTLKLIYNSSRANFEDIALVVQQQLKAVGINVEIQGYDANSFFNEFFEYDGVSTGYDLGINGYAANGDPMSQQGMFSSMSNNMISSEKLDELWSQGELESDPEKRAEIFEQIAQEIKDLDSMYMVGDTNIVFAVQKGYKGLDSVHLIPLFVDYMQIYKEAE